MKPAIVSALWINSVYMERLLVQYGGAMGVGIILGMLLAVPMAGMVSRMTVTTTGVLLPVRFAPVPGQGVHPGFLYDRADLLIGLSCDQKPFHPLGVAMAVMGHSIFGLVEQEWKNFGILKTLGFTGRKLSGQLLVQYLTSARLWQWER